MTDVSITANSGSITVACTACDWSRPPGRHPWGTPDRPGCADYVDAEMPRISRHVDATGHRVRVVLTTWWPLEQSAMLIGPRTAVTS
jgi:hypothetical protein